MLRDKLGRPLRVLRISLTDRCNLRCGFCMPPDRTYKFTDNLMTPEEIEKIVRVFAKLGVKKVRLTGGEPLLRKDIVEIIEKIKKIEGIEDIALTTNGIFLKNKLRELKSAGLKRITVSVHALDQDINRKITNRNVNLKEVLEAVDLAKSFGFKVKVNSVIIRGVNDNQIIPLASYFKERNITIRFIEYMDVGTLNGWDYGKVFTAEEILKEMSKHFSFRPIPKKPNETALRFIYDDGGEFGIIASVTKPFCRGCDRIRLSADGKIYTCLFAEEGYDIRHFEDPEKLIKEIWKKREDRYSELRKETRKRKKVEMFKVGG